MLVLRILLGFAFIIWFLFLWSRRKFYKLMFQLPGPIGLPLLGVAYKFRALEDLFNFALDMKKECGFPMLTWVGTVPIFVLADPITAQDILTSPHCTNKAKLYEPLAEVLGNGLLTINDPDWAVHRKLLNHTLNPEHLRSFVPIFNKKTKDFLRKFEATYGGEPINALPLLQRLTMNTALQTTMGLRRDDEGKTYNKTEERLFGYYHEYSSHINQKIHEKLEISQRSEIAEITVANTENDDIGSQKTQSHYFVDIAVDLIRSGKLTATDVKDHCNNMVAGAYETTATTIFHALIMLAMNPKYQQIAFEELFSMYADRDNVTVTDEDLQHLVYLEMVVNETMRLIPTIPVVGRTTTADVTLSSGIVLPAGIQVIIHFYDLHRNEDIWGPNASEFNPENFLPENMSDKHPYSFIPFTKGVRICIGYRYAMNSVKTMLAIILRKYSVTTTSKFEDFRFEAAISTRIANPPLMKFHLREK